jgi:LacI family transcriptional regulator
MDRVRIKDIAEMAGVSTGTVDRVIHGRDEVNPATREKVLTFLQKSGYQPNLTARSLAIRKPYLFSVIIPAGGEGNPYWDMPLEGIQRAVEAIRDTKAEMDLLTFDIDSASSFSDSLEKCLLSSPDGIILAPVFEESALVFIGKLNEKKIPVVLIDSMLEAVETLSVFSQDTLRSGYLAARLMCYGTENHLDKWILHLAKPKGIIRHLTRREEGFRSFYQGCTEKPEILTFTIDISEPDEPYRSLDRLFTDHTAPDGIFVTGSRASMVAKFLEETGRTGQVLIGYDLTPSNRQYLTQGTIDFLISQKPEQQGYNSIMALFSHLVYRQVPDKVHLSPIDIITRENLEYYQPS